MPDKKPNIDLFKIAEDINNRGNIKDATGISDNMRKESNIYLQDKLDEYNYLNQGSYTQTSLGLDDNEFEKRIDKGISLSPYFTQNEINKIKADNQSVLEQTGNALMRIGLGELVLGTIGGFFNIVDGVVNSFTGSYTLQDPIAKFFNEKKEELDNAFEIYRKNPNKSFDVTDFGWWADNSVSIASTLSLMLPAAGWAKGLSWLGKATSLSKVTNTLSKSAAKASVKVWDKLAKDTLNTSNKISKLRSMEGRINKWNKIYKDFAGATGMAALSRAGENQMEANSVHDIVYSDSLENIKGMIESDKANGTHEYEKFLENNPELKGLSSIEEMANVIANDAATKTFKGDWAMILSDILQFRAVGGLASRAMKRITTPRQRISAENIKRTLGGAKPEELIKNNFINRRKESFKHILKHPASIVTNLKLTEGIEEMWQGVYTEKGFETAQKYFDPNMTPRSINSYLKDLEMWEQGFWGALGGIAFGAGAKQYYNIKDYIHEVKNKKKMSAEDFEMWKKSRDSIKQLDHDKTIAEINKLVDDITTIENGKNPYTYQTNDVTGETKLGADGKPIAVELTEEEKDELIDRTINEFIDNKIMSSINDGSYELIKDILKSKQLDKYLHDKGVRKTASEKLIADSINERIDYVGGLYRYYLNEVEYNNIKHNNPFVTMLTASQLTREKMNIDTTQTKLDNVHKVINTTKTKEANAANVESNDVQTVIDNYHNDILINNIARHIIKLDERINKLDKLVKDKTISKEAAILYKQDYEKEKDNLQNIIENTTLKTKLDELVKNTADINLLKNLNITTDKTDNISLSEELKDLIKTETNLQITLAQLNSSFNANSEGFKSRYNEIAQAHDTFVKNKIQDYFNILADYINKASHKDSAYDRLIKYDKNDPNYPIFDKKVKEALEVIRYGYINQVGDLGTNSMNYMNNKIRFEQLLKEVKDISKTNTAILNQDQQTKTQPTNVIDTKVDITPEEQVKIKRKNEITNRIQEIDDKIVKITNEKQQLESEIETINKDNDSINEKIDELNKDLKVLTEELESLNKKLETVNEELDKSNAKIEQYKQEIEESQDFKNERSTIRNGYVLINLSQIKDRLSETYNKTTLVNSIENADKTLIKIAFSIMSTPYGIDINSKTYEINEYTTIDDILTVIQNSINILENIIGYDKNSISQSFIDKFYKGDEEQFIIDVDRILPELSKKYIEIANNELNYEISDNIYKDYINLLPKNVIEEFIISLQEEVKNTIEGIKDRIISYEGYVKKLKTQKENIEKELENKVKEIESKTKDLKEAKKPLEKSENTNNENKTKIENVIKEKEKLTKERENLVNELTELNKQQDNQTKLKQTPEQNPGVVDRTPENLNNDPTSRINDEQLPPDGPFPTGELPQPLGENPEDESLVFPNGVDTQAEPEQNPGVDLYTIQDLIKAELAPEISRIFINSSEDYTNKLVEGTKEYEDLVEQLKTKVQEVLIANNITNVSEDDLTEQALRSYIDIIQNFSKYNDRYLRYAKLLMPNNYNSIIDTLSEDRLNDILEMFNNFLIEYAKSKKLKQYDGKYIIRIDELFNDIIKDTIHEETITTDKLINLYNVVSIIVNKVTNNNAFKDIKLTGVNKFNAMSARQYIDLLSKTRALHQREIAKQLHIDFSDIYKIQDPNLREVVSQALLNKNQIIAEIENDKKTNIANTISFYVYYRTSNGKLEKCKIGALRCVSKNATNTKITTNNHVTGFAYNIDINPDGSFVLDTDEFFNSLFTDENKELLDKLIAYRVGKTKIYANAYSDVSIDKNERDRKIAQEVNDLLTEEDINNILNNPQVKKLLDNNIFKFTKQNAEEILTDREKVEQLINTVNNILFYEKDSLVRETIEEDMELSDSITANINTIRDSYNVWRTKVFQNYNQTYELQKAIEETQEKKIKLKLDVDIIEVPNLVSSRDQYQDIGEKGLAMNITENPIVGVSSNKMQLVDENGEVFGDITPQLPFSPNVNQIGFFIGKEEYRKQGIPPTIAYLIRPNNLFETDSTNNVAKELANAFKVELTNIITQFLNTDKGGISFDELSKRLNALLNFRNGIFSSRNIKLIQKENSNAITLIIGDDTNKRDDANKKDNIAITFYKTNNDGTTSKTISVAPKGFDTDPVYIGSRTIRTNNTNLDILKGLTNSENKVDPNLINGYIIGIIESNINNLIINNSLEVLRKDSMGETYNYLVHKSQDKAKVLTMTLGSETFTFNGGIGSLLIDTNAYKTNVSRIGENGSMSTSEVIFANGGFIADVYRETGKEKQAIDKTDKINSTLDEVRNTGKEFKRNNILYISKEYDTINLLAKLGVPQPIIDILTNQQDLGILTPKTTVEVRPKNARKQYNETARYERREDKIVLTQSGLLDIAKDTTGTALIRNLLHENIHRKLNELKNVQIGKLSRYDIINNELESIYEAFKSYVEQDTSELGIKLKEQILDVLENNYKNDKRTKLEEFLAESLTQKVLMDYLNGIDYKRQDNTIEYETEKKSIFQKIIDVILKIFGIENITSNSILAEEYRILGDILEKQNNNEVNSVNNNSVVNTKSPVEEEIPTEEQPASNETPKEKTKIKRRKLSGVNSVEDLNESKSLTTTIQGTTTEIKLEYSENNRFDNPYGVTFVDRMNTMANRFNKEYKDGINAAIENNDFNYSCK